MRRRTGPTGRRGAEPWFLVAAAVLKPLLLVLTSPRWEGAQHVPRRGGVVLCANHISHLDPLTLAHFVWDAGRRPRFLGKASLWRVPVLGAVLRGARQIPVSRESADAARAYDAAVAAVRQGEAVCIYPEGTVTREPHLWPMVGKTGAARIGLTTGAPVVPLAQWGVHRMLPPYARRPRLRLRLPVHVVAGAPVDFGDLVGRPLDAAVLAEATERVMAAISELLEGVRGEQAPAVRFDPRAAGLPVTGPFARRVADDDDPHRHGPRA